MLVVAVVCCVAVGIVVLEKILEEAYLKAYWEKNLWLQGCSTGTRTLDYLQKDFDCDLRAELLCITKDCETKTKAVYVCKNPVNNTSNTSISTTSGLVYSSQGSLSTNSTTWFILETLHLCQQHLFSGFSRGS